jgi:tetratricopeptide (TPR) repeat protein
VHVIGLVRPLRLIPLCVLVGSSLACQTLAPQPDPDADQALTLIVARLQMHLRDDPYRVHAAPAGNGQTVFEDAHWRIVRLHEARERAGLPPGDVDLVLHFARGRALERMRRYDEAARAYEHVAGSASVLADGAAAAGEVMRSFAEHSQPLRSDTVDAIQGRLARWRSLVREHDDTTYEPMARQEAEAWEMLRVELLARWDDSDAAIHAARRLIERNRESKLLAQHFIRLGDLYAEAARHEFVQHRARVRALDLQRYDALLEQAFAAYEQAMDERRPSFRREAATKIESLLAYHDGVRSHVR